MSELPPFPTDPADLPGWVAGLTREQQAALAQQVTGGSFLASAAACLGLDAPPDPFAAFDRRNPEIELPPAPAAPSAYTIRVDLVGAKPPIWRRMVVRSDVTLDVVHRVLQASFGWWDYHLHRFSVGDPYASPYFTTPADLEQGEDEGTPEEVARLDQVLTEAGARLTYEYDFGDGWTHRLLLEAVEPWPPEESRTAWCVNGRRAGPLEDSGGIWGYGELAAWVRSGYAPDRAPDNAEDLEDWIPDGFDPDHFSVAETDEAIESALLGDAAAIARSVGARDGLMDLARRLPGEAGATVARWLLSAGLDDLGLLDVAAAQAATRSWRVLLRHVGDGVVLTKAGYLPPTVVEAVYDDLDLAERWLGKGNREDQTYPVLELREQAQALGLLRKAKGSLAPTAKGRQLADDPVALMKHVAARLPLGRRDDEQDAGWLMLLATAAGETPAAAAGHLATLLRDLGWRTSGGALDANAAAHSARPTQGVLRRAGDPGDRRSGAPAPRAALLARLALVSGAARG
ncbi:MAG: plasmid pRiA4b ORF-3 family protein [Nocardioides sp.]